MTCCDGPNCKETNLVKEQCITGEMKTSKGKKTGKSYFCSEECFLGWMFLILVKKRQKPNRLH